MDQGVTPATTPALSIANIEVVYHHTVQALRGLSIEVPDGKVVALLGSNGAGKTTTLKAASGILPLEIRTGGERPDHASSGRTSISVRPRTSCRGADWHTCVRAGTCSPN